MPVVQADREGLDIAHLEPNFVVDALMHRQDGGVMYRSVSPHTTFRVLTGGEQPFVELLRTAQGEEDKITMRVLGSSASRLALEGSELDIIKGLIVPEHYIVVRRLHNLYTLPGLVREARSGKSLKAIRRSA